MGAGARHPGGGTVSGARPGEAYRLARAAYLLRRGEVVAHATEGVIGLAASVWSAAGRRRLAAIKGRDGRKPVIVIAASIGQIQKIVDLSVPYQEEIRASWPGPNTWILPAAATAPDWACDARRRIAVRVTSHHQAAALCRRAGPLFSTSANRAGRPAALAVAEARAVFGGEVAFYLPGVPDSPGRASRIREGRSGIVVRA